MVMATTGYFDASGKMDTPVLSIAGFVAPINTWSKFEQAWEKVLKREGVTIFHATDFASSRREFEGWKNDRCRRNRFLHDLGVVLRNSVNEIFMINIETEAWKAVNEEYMLEETFHSPYALAGFTIVNLVRAWRSKHNLQAPIEYVFEDGDEGWDGLVSLCESHCRVTPIRLPKSKAVPCQAADMVAWKNRIACTEAMKHQPSHEMTIPEIVGQVRLIAEDLASLNKALVVEGTCHVYGRERLLENCDNWNAQKR